jgi:hypothetical protein
LAVPLKLQYSPSFAQGFQVGAGVAVGGTGVGVGSSGVGVVGIGVSVANRPPSPPPPTPTAAPPKPKKPSPIEVKISPTSGPIIIITDMTVMATKARIREYSTRPWPFSFLEDEVSIIDFSLLKRFEKNYLILV